MAKFNLSQFRSKVRQLESKQRQAINKYNQEVRNYNSKVNQVINNYNQEVRRYNSRVRANRQKLLSQLNQLKSSSTTVRYQTLRTSTITLSRRYETLESKETNFVTFRNGAEFLDLSEQETANSLEVSNLLESEQDSNQVINQFEFDSQISSELNQISPDLDSRWKGALFSLSPQNPDASRHFCTSAREIFIQILDLKAPNDCVVSHDSNCDKTDLGHPTRKAKIRYLLINAGIADEDAVDFVNEDVSNVLELFRVFNAGTHGKSGQYNINRLLAIKNRVENGIKYLSTICSFS